MRRTAVLVAALVVVGTGVPLVAGMSPDDGEAAGGVAAVDSQDETAASDSENETPPGARLVGVVSVQAADVQGDLSSRSFGLQMAAAESNASKAAVVANRTGELDDRLEVLRDRKERLVEARENGSISEVRFRAEMTGLAAELSAANRLVEQAGSASDSVPASTLEEHGVNATSLERLRQTAGDLSGPEVSAIARDVAGPNVSVGPPGDGAVGPPDDDTGDIDFPEGVTAGDLPAGVSVDDLPEDVSESDLRTLADDPSDDVIEEILGEDDSLGGETDDDAGGDDAGNETDDSDDSTTENDDGLLDDNTTTVPLSLHRLGLT